MKKLFIIIVFLFQTSAHGSAVVGPEGAEEVRIAHYIPFYRATKEIEGRLITLKIVGSMHTLSDKIVPMEIMDDIMHSPLLMTEIRGPYMCEEESDEEDAAPIDGGPPEGDPMDVALDCLFHDESKVTPKILRSNYLATTPDATSITEDYFLENYQWSRLITFDDKIKLLSILNDLLKEKEREDDIERLHHNGLDPLNAEMLSEVLDMRLKSLNVTFPTKPNYGLDFHQSGTMDPALHEAFEQLGKRTLSFERCKDRVRANESVTPLFLLRKN